MKTFDLAILAGAMALAIGSVVLAPRWAGPRQEKDHAVASVAAESYAAQDTTGPDPVATSWQPPERRRAESEWFFDLFTPPIVSYEPGARKFHVTPPNCEGKDGPGDRNFGLELVEIRPLPCRLRIAGFAGAEGNYVVLLEDIPSGETCLLRNGQTDEAAGLTLRSFETRGAKSRDIDGRANWETLARAVVFDRRVQREIVLGDEPGAAPAGLAAVFRAPDDSSDSRPVSAGQSLAIGGAVFVVNTLVADPPAAEVTRQASAGSPEWRRWLKASPHATRHDRPLSASLRPTSDLPPDTPRSSP